jgi:MazG C-terminal domain
MDLREYQSESVKTSEPKLIKPGDATAATFGLVQAIGSIGRIYKKLSYQKIDPQDHRELMTTELGDVLWYTAAVATAFGLDLEDIARKNLKLTRDRHAVGSDVAAFPSLTIESECPATERFPRRLVFRFTERVEDGKPSTCLRLIEAEPNAFPHGPIVDESGKPRLGFRVGEQFGDCLTDNAHTEDGYRFHDAIHLGFLAILGWSPIIRRLLLLKRKYRADFDANEDGARAAYAEEGLSAILARLAEKRNSFATESDVDGDSLQVFRLATTGLEVNVLPAWLWKRAIVAGFNAMSQLVKNDGGYLIADLDQRTLEYATTYVPTTK